MKRKIEYWIFILILVSQSCASLAQTKLDGAYGGSGFFTSVSGMIRNDIAIYFRPDGTYCNQLGEPDWQTRVNGRYTVSGKEVTMISSEKGNKHHATIQSNGNLTYSGTFLIKFQTMNSLPAKTLEYNMIVSGGGGITGGAYGARRSYNSLSFDGKGNFSHSAFHGTLVSGAAVAGGQVNSSAGDGTYTIDNSELKLQYKDGRTARMSFFYSPVEPVIALIDGSLYYAPDDDKVIAKSSSSSAISPDGEDLLKKAYRAHGGKFLDEVATFRMEGMMNRFKVVVTVDFSRRWVRNEFYQGNKLLMLEQLEGDRGWQTEQGNRSVMTADRVKDIQYSLITGIWGLRQNNQKNVTVLKTERNTNSGGVNVFVRIKGQDYVWMFDERNRMIGEGTVVNGVQQMEASTDFRTVSNIVIPFTQSDQTGAQNFTIKWNRVVINLPLTEKDWSEPR